MSEWHPVYWHWWVAAVVLLTLEALAPATFFLWMAISAGVVGGLLLLMPGMAFTNQLLWFSALSVAAIVAMLKYRKSRPSKTDGPALNQRGDQYFGNVYLLEKPIRQGFGELKIDGTLWRIEGPDMVAGRSVKVIGREGNTLRVEPAE